MADNKFLQSVKSIKESAVTAKVNFPISKDLTVPSEYNFNLVITPINSKLAQKLRKKYTVRKFDKVTQQQTYEIDAEKFTEAVLAEVVVNWEGMTVEKWNYYVPFKRFQFPKDEVIPYDQELAKIFFLEGVGTDDEVTELVDLAKNPAVFNGSFNPDEIITGEDEIKN